MKLSGRLLVVLFVLQACSENPEVEPEPEPEPVGFLTVSLDANYNSFNDMWVFGTDETGKVLDAQPVKPGMTVTLKALSPPEVVNLTVYYNNGGTKVNHLFYTYAGIARGDKITFGPSKSSGFLPPVAGKATINIQNCDTYATTNLSDGYTYSQLNSQNDTFIDASLDLRQQASRILISSRTATDQPVYGWVDNVVNGGVYTVDFGSLTPFPKTISVSYSESISAVMIGKNTNDGGIGYFVTNDGFSKTPGTPASAKFGYMDGFDEYSFFVQTTNTMSTYYRHTHYKKYGTTMPLEVTLPDNSLSILNPSIGNFNFTYSSGYTYLYHYWKKEAADHTIHWIVFTDKSTTPPITELPEAFIVKYPAVSLSNLNYWISEFYKYEDGYTFSQFLHDIFEGGSVPDRHEYY